MITGNFYDILGVSQDASETEIKKAYRGLSLKHHPDRGGDAERFKEVSEAYETLSDAGKRQQYDNELRFGGSGGGIDLADLFGGGVHNIFQNLFHGPGGPGGPGIHIFTAGPGQGPFGQGGPNIHFATGPGSGQNPFAGGPIPQFFGHFMKPPSIQVEVALEMEQVLSGCVVPISYERFVVRPHDQRRIPEHRTIEVAIQAGVEDGEVIVLPDVGNMIADMAGDLKIMVQIVPHPVFQRDGLNLVYTKTVSLKEALCGLSFDVPLLNQRVLTIKNIVPPIRIVYPGMEQVCPGYGLSRGGQTGSLIIRFQITFPVALDDGVRQQLVEMLP
jgi:DnaJ-class molecular chaperone